VQIPKEQILQMLMQRGQQDKAQQADQQLPDQVDPEQHGGLLEKIGLNPQDLMGMLGGGGGGGGLGGKLGL
jgi:hypothetical protein